MPQATLLNLAFLGLDTLGAVLATVLGFGVLVFVHELGHFLAAKWVGVRVEVFSLGFGPRLLGFVRGATDYRISALPLGGYVKMLGQDDGDPNVPRTNAPDDFRNKSIGGRMLILVAGVVMNTIFALVAFIVAFALGVEFTAPEIGVVVPNSAANQARAVGAPPGTKVGLRSGDQILSINGSQVFAWEDVTTTIALSSGPVTIEIARPDSATGVFQRMTFEATPRRNEKFPVLGVESVHVVGEVPDGSAVQAAGLKKNDQLLDAGPPGAALGERDIPHFDQVVRENPGKPLEILVQRRAYDEDGRPLEKRPERVKLNVTPAPRPVYEIGVTFDTDTVRIQQVDADPVRGVLEPDDILVSIDGKKASQATLPDLVRAAAEAHEIPGADKSAPVSVVFERRKEGAWERREAQIPITRKPNDEGWLLGVVYLSDKVKSVEPGSPAASLGIEPGDFVTHYWSQTTLWFWTGKERAKKEQIDAVCNQMKDQPWKIEWEKPAGALKEGVIQARKTERTWGDLEIVLSSRGVTIRRGPFGACQLGFHFTVQTFKRLVQTLRGLFSRSVSTKELGGPIQIASLTYKIAQSKGLGYLFYFLAILSVNLAVLNILPIPVLDGGHIFLLTIEKLKGRPLSDDVMRYVQYAGLVFVIGLMVYVTFNDISRELK